MEQIYSILFWVEKNRLARRNIQVCLFVIIINTTFAIKNCPIHQQITFYFMRESIVLFNKSEDSRTPNLFIFACSDFAQSNQSIRSQWNWNCSRFPIPTFFTFSTAGFKRRISTQCNTTFDKTQFNTTLSKTTRVICMMRERDNGKDRGTLADLAYLHGARNGHHRCQHNKSLWFWH